MDAIFYFHASDFLNFELLLCSGVYQGSLDVTHEVISIDLVMRLDCAEKIEWRRPLCQMQSVGYVRYWCTHLS